MFFLSLLFFSLSVPFAQLSLSLSQYVEVKWPAVAWESVLYKPPPSRCEGCLDCLVPPSTTPLSVHLFDVKVEEQGGGVWGELP